MSVRLPIRSHEDGRAIKLLYVVDEFTREALAMEAERRIDGDRVVDVLDRIIREQGRRPEFVRVDNGPEMTSHALRDLCRFSRTGAAFIEPGAPWENPFLESFNSRVRDELLSVEVFTCLTEAKVMIEGLPAGLQPLPAAPGPRHDDPSRVRCRLPRTATGHRTRSGWGRAQ